MSKLFFKQNITKQNKTRKRIATPFFALLPSCVDSRVKKVWGGRGRMNGAKLGFQRKTQVNGNKCVCNNLNVAKHPLNREKYTNKAES